MQLIYEGKTKDVYNLGNGQVLLKFKDDVTGEDGVFDPGANTVGLTLEGAGRSGLRTTSHFFEKVIQAGIPTHFIKADLDNATMTVKAATMFGTGLEVICRYRAVGSFYRRYGALCTEGQKLPGLVEVTIKDDERGDPPISKETLAALQILSMDEYAKLEKMATKVSTVILKELAKNNLELYDIKLEFGRDQQTEELMLIDEISGGNMRVYTNNGKYIDPLTLEKIIFS